MLKKKNTYLWIGIGLGLIGILGGTVWWWQQSQTEYAQECDTQTFTVRGESLSPLVKKGTEIKAVSFECRKPRKGDLVVFETAKNADPVIKRVAAVPGDTLKVKSDNTIVVNGKPAQTPDKKAYKATEQTTNMFSLYEGALTGYLVLGKPGSLDSGRLGVLGKEYMTHVLPRSQL